MSGGRCLDSGDASERVRKLTSALSILKTDRARLLGELNAKEEDNRVAIAELARVADERVAKVIEKTKSCSRVAEKKIAELTERVHNLTEVYSILAKAREEAERAKAEQDLLFGTGA